jgi:DNA-binding transcriptional LysR family regulator
MELRDIEYFATVAEHGHLGRAANALGLSQPALSKSLRRLEHGLQAKVVKRTPKGVELTAEGSVLLARVSELRLSLQSIGREIADVRQGHVGHLRIGVGFAGPEQLYAAAVATLLKDVSRTSLVATVSDNDLMIPALCNGELDLIVNYLSGRFIPNGLVCEHLYDDEHVVVASRKHRLVGRKRVALADLVEERWAVSARVLTSQQRLNEAFRDAGLPPPYIAFECRSPGLRLRTVASTDLLDWTSRRYVEKSELSSQLAVVPAREFEWARPIGVIYRRETYLPPIIHRLIEILRTTAKKLLIER